MISAFQAGAFYGFQASGDIPAPVVTPRHHGGGHDDHGGDVVRKKKKKPEHTFAFPELKTRPPLPVMPVFDEPPVIHAPARVVIDVEADDAIVMEYVMKFLEANG